MASPHEYQSIDEYIRQLDRCLIGLPISERIDGTEEARQHLEALVATEQTSNCPQEEAVRRALEKFGDPKTIAKGLKREYLKDQRENKAGLIVKLFLILAVAESSSLNLYLLLFFGASFLPRYMPGYFLLWHVSWEGFLLAGIACGFAFGTLSQISSALLKQRERNNRHLAQKWYSHLSDIGYEYCLPFLLTVLSYGAIQQQIECRCRYAQLVNTYQVSLMLCTWASLLLTKVVLMQRLWAGQSST